MRKVCGLDVHKNSIFCGIYNGKKQEDVVIYGTLSSDIRTLARDLLAEGVKEVAMESTGIYWIPIWNILETYDFELTLVNPYYIKQMPGRKSDVKDAQWIAKLLYRKMLRGSYVPDQSIRELRSYSRREFKLQGRRTSSLQELERTLEMCNIRITSFTSNIDALSVRKIVSLIILGETNPKILAECVHGRIRNKHKEKIELSLDGVVPEHLRFTLELIYKELLQIEEHIQMLNNRILEICDRQYKEEMELLISIPGVQSKSASIIIAESGHDLKAFDSSKRYASWVGLCSRNDESAGKFKSRAITKGNRYLRRVLVQVAWASTRSKGTYFEAKFKKLIVRKGPTKSLVAIARKMSVIIWSIIREKKMFDPDMLPIYDPKNLEKVIEYHKESIKKLQDIFELEIEANTFHANA